MSDTIGDFLRTPIRETALKEEFDQVIGHYAFVCSSLAEAEARELVLDVAIAKEKLTFGEQLAAEMGKVSEAFIERSLVKDAKWLELIGQLNGIKAAQKSLTGLEKSLRMKHEACIALCNRQSSELRRGS